MPLTGVDGMASIPVGLPCGEQKIRTLDLFSPSLVKHLMGLAVEGSMGQPLRASLLIANQLPPSNGDQPASPNTNGNDGPRNVSRPCRANA